MHKKNIGIIGGGQLGMLLIQYGGFNRDDIFIRVIDPDCECSCSTIADELIVGKFDNYQDLSRFAQGLDVITYETEHIAVNELKKISATQPNTYFIPSIETLEIIQNKRSQKEFLQANDIPLVPFEIIVSNKVVTSRKVWKSIMGGYDGKGVRVLNADEIVPEGILEDYIPSRQMREFCVNVVISNSQLPPNECSMLKCMQDFGVNTTISETPTNAKCFLPTKMIFHDKLNMLNYCMCSCELANDVRQRLMEIAQKCALSFNSVGLFAVEMFLLNDGTIYVNEVAPRPHNSSHHTIETLPADQNAYYALGNILQNNQFHVNQHEEHNKHYIMQNILGPEYMKFDTKYNILLLADNVKVINYKKSATKPNRKIGHLTYVSGDNHFHTNFGDVQLENSTLVVPENGVAVVMGSTSDWIIMKQACEILDDLGVSYAKTIVSAHRTPDRLRLFGERACNAGLKCIIAGAGGAAHLPGMLAAYTEIPVIGVPIKSENSSLSGLDAMYSILQMPAGVPVATVAINGAKNAGILAAQILQYFPQIREYKNRLKDSVIANIHI